MVRTAASPCIISHVGALAGCGFGMQQPVSIKLMAFSLRVQLLYNCDEVLETITCDSLQQ